MIQNSSSIPGTSLLPGGTDTLTTVHLVLLALLALLVLAGIVWGIRLKRRRTIAMRELREHNRVFEAAPAPPVPARRAPDETPAAARAGMPAAAVAPTLPRDEATLPAPPPPASDDAANGPVTQLKGLGPKVAAQLAELGITTVGQIASLSDAEAQALDTRLGAFTGRMARDRWVEQARLLAAGDRGGFEAAFGRL